MAEMAAREIIKRDQYKLQRVYECNTCAYQEKAGDALDRIATRE